MKTTAKDLGTAGKSYGHWNVSPRQRRVVDAANVRIELLDESRGPAQADVVDEGREIAGRLEEREKSTKDA